MYICRKGGLWNGWYRNQEIDTQSFHNFGALAEVERDLANERTYASSAAPQARGRLGRRPKKLATVKQHLLIRILYDCEQADIDTSCATLGISRAIGADSNPINSVLLVMTDGPGILLILIGPAQHETIVCVASSRSSSASLIPAVHLSWRARSLDGGEGREDLVGVRGALRYDP